MERVVPVIRMWIDMRTSGSSRTSRSKLHRILREHYAYPFTSFNPIKKHLLNCCGPEGRALVG